MHFLSFFAYLLGACLVAATSTAVGATNFSASQKADIEKIAHDYIVQHPEVLVEASKILQEREQHHVTQKAVQAIPANAKAIFEAMPQAVAGNPKGDITLVEFYDFQCSYCRLAMPMIAQFLKKDPNLRMVYKEFPIFGSNSEYAAKAVLAARKQGKYQSLHDNLMQLLTPLNQDIVLKAATSVGINVAQLEKDMTDPAIQKELDTNMQLADKLGLMGTPAFIIANYPVSGKQFKYFFHQGVPTNKMLENYIRSARQKN